MMMINLLHTLQIKGIIATSHIFKLNMNEKSCNFKFVNREFSVKIEITVNKLLQWREYITMNTLI